jgi:hypothetical protein
MTNRWFGPKPFANICSMIPETPTPEGEVCGWCEEPIVKGDRGIEMPTVERGEWFYKPWHQECQIRLIVGSKAHLERRCSCFGGRTEDVDTEPGMTKRQEAKYVLELWLAGKGKPPDEEKKS